MTILTTLMCVDDVDNVEEFDNIDNINDVENNNKMQIFECTETNTM